MKILIGIPFVFLLLCGCLANSRQSHAVEEMADVTNIETVDKVLTQPLDTDTTAHILDVKYMGIDGDYDYEALLYEYKGEAGSFINIDHSTGRLNKGDSIRLTIRTKTLENAGDSSLFEADVISHIELISTGKLSRFLESAPPVRYGLSEEFTSSLKEIVQRETALFLAAGINEALAAVPSRSEGGVIGIQSGFINTQDSIGEDYPEIYCHIIYINEEKTRHIVTIGITPGYYESRFYVLTEGEGFVPATVEF